MAAPRRLGRKKPVPACPNPLFVQWLTEWRDEAAEKGKKTQFVYQRALGSLRRYPLPLDSGREAAILQHFGDGICRRLDERLERHRAEQGADAPLEAMGRASPSRGGQESDPPGTEHRSLNNPSASQTLLGDLEPPPTRKARPPRQYVPAPHSGAYAVLLALYKDSMSPRSRGFLTKPELQRAAQPLCDKSFTLVDPGNRYTAWASVGTLIRKELVLKTNVPARYSLTPQGLVLAQRLVAVEQALISEGRAPESKTPQGTEPTDPAGEEKLRPEPQLLDSALGPLEGTAGGSGGQRPHDPEFVLRPGQFDIILCVDFIETMGGPAARKQDLMAELHRNAVPFDVRKLHVGDFMWVARERVQPRPGQLHLPPAQELALDYVVERKRMADLCGSIIDGRFREQKFRLRRCGLRHPIYLLEESGSTQHLSLPESTLQQAATSTQVVDGFFVKRTRDLRESAAYLTIMTRHLNSLYGNKTLMSCTKEESQGRGPLQPNSDSCTLMTFQEFNEGAVKNKAQTVREVFARQLMQISGVSGEKAAAILERYSTPASLLAAYSTCPDPESRDKLLSTIKCGKLQRNLGPALSRTLSQLYCSPGPLS
ncbi:structure-specific endonuclease subunit MUS81 isoform X3 [Caretta caretta]|uniref:structure-specific endonuclease subunit MUS81 isoform X3 n=1 Tax=Caretta caretta TaxID=8467 RepID=UPI002094F116|nr:crossover junction endonuclease MUS81 isoform X2 [Caretta caretta]